jgi:hypothetical protein
MLDLGAIDALLCLRERKDSVNARTTTTTRRISSPLKELNVSSRVKLPNRRINVKLQYTKT